MGATISSVVVAATPSGDPAHVWSELQVPLPRIRSSSRLRGDPRRLGIHGPTHAP